VDGEAVRRLRKKRGFTQERLAQGAGVDVKTIRKAERSQRLDLATLTRISFALEVEVSDLIVPMRSHRELEISRRDAVLRWHRAWDARDVEALLSVYHDAAVLHQPGEPAIPFAGEHRGKQAIRRAHEIAWSTCKTDPVGADDFRLLVSDNSVILNGKMGFREPGGESVKLACLQIFTFLGDTDLVIDHIVEYDTLNFARALGFAPPP
jgi:transcriptional regulator with XRE-family HTH domain